MWALYMLLAAVFQIFLYVELLASDVGICSRDGKLDIQTKQKL